MSIKRLNSGADERSSNNHTFNVATRAGPPQHVRSAANQSANIICGRGLHVSCHHGNLKLHRIVDRYRETYLASPRRNKSMIVRQIINEIKSTGAKFIRRADHPDESTDDVWVEVDDKTAYTKVSHALRLRKPFSGQRNAQSLSRDDADPSSMPQHGTCHLSRLSTSSSQSQLMSSAMPVGQPQSMIATLSHPAQPQAPHILGSGCGELLSDPLFVSMYAKIALAILTQPIHRQPSGQGQVSSGQGHQDCINAPKQTENPSWYHISP